VFADIEGVVKLDDAVDGLVVRRVPPVEASYHRNVPVDDAFADSTTVPVPHVVPFTPVGVTGTEFTMADTAVLGTLGHDPLLNST
jgi:hypothetical protein